MKKRKKFSLHLFLNNLFLRLFHKQLFLTECNRDNLNLMINSFFLYYFEIIQVEKVVYGQTWYQKNS